jgi:hypothetical protein
MMDVGSNSSSCSSVPEYPIFVTQKSPADAHEFVGQRAYSNMRMHARSQAADPNVQRIVALVLPNPKRPRTLHK